MKGAPARGAGWALTGLPLLLAGIGCFYLMSLFPNGPLLLLCFALAVGLLIGSGLARFPDLAARRLAVVAWLPMFFFVPVGTVLFFLAVPVLWRDEYAGRRIPLLPRPVTPVPDELRRVIEREAERVLGIRDRNWDLEIVRDLRVTPANLSDFLDELEESHGLPVGEADRRGLRTLSDVAGFLSRALAA